MTLQSKGNTRISATSIYLNGFLFLFHQRFDVVFCSDEQIVPINASHFRLHQHDIVILFTGNIESETYLVPAAKKTVFDKYDQLYRNARTLKQNAEIIVCLRKNAAFFQTILILCFNKNTNRLYIPNGRCFCAVFIQCAAKSMCPPLRPSSNTHRTCLAFI